MNPEDIHHDDIVYLGSSNKSIPQPVQAIVLHIHQYGDQPAYHLTFRASDHNVVYIGRKPSNPRRPARSGAVPGVAEAQFSCLVVSAQHAKLVFGEQSGLVYLIDSQSRHGTHLKGRDRTRTIPPNTKVPLQDGDEITLGKIVGDQGQTVHPITMDVELVYDRFRPRTPTKDYPTGFGSYGVHNEIYDDGGSSAEDSDSEEGGSPALQESDDASSSEVEEIQPFTPGKSSNRPLVFDVNPFDPFDTPWSAVETSSAPFNTNSSLPIAQASEDRFGGQNDWYKAGELNLEREIFGRSDSEKSDVQSSAINALNDAVDWVAEVEQIQSDVSLPKLDIVSQENEAVNVPKESVPQVPEERLEHTQERLDSLLSEVDGLQKQQASDADPAALTEIAKTVDALVQEVKSIREDYQKLSAINDEQITLKRKRAEETDDAIIAIGAQPSRPMKRLRRVTASVVEKAALVTVTAVATWSVLAFI